MTKTRKYKNSDVAVGGVVHSPNPNTWEKKQDQQKFKANLSATL